MGIGDCRGNSLCCHESAHRFGSRVAGAGISEVYCKRQISLALFAHLRQMLFSG